MKNTTRIYLGDVKIMPASACTIEATYHAHLPVIAFGHDRRAALIALANELRAIATSAERLAMNLPTTLEHS